MDIFLLRHAESISSQNGSFASDAGEPLTEKGYKDAERIVPLLSELDLDKVLCSPYLRARDTVAPFVRESGVDLTILPSLAEGQLVLDNIAISPEPADYILDESGELQPAKPETPGAFLSRVRQSVGSLLDNRDERILVVSHGHMIREILNVLMRVDTKIRFPHDNCGMSHLTLGNDFTCHYINRTL
ncbi:histidine phosphatase family protein [Veronia pacifica]|uniref:Phosphoglycerate mutase n=1 Tax=Veronia pacifica TaxID=1080227 RepID=A0A1C3ESS1_9GAMM|nr:histidine phosphatase family protein [Veronia pacifica]ODA36193.1 hypothetical protein A8L45_00895 [Veronia pacifica]